MLPSAPIPDSRSNHTSGTSTGTRWLSVVMADLVGSSLPLAASQIPASSLGERAEGAERVVVGRVASVNGVWRTNEFGDRLILSIVRVSVEETLKGQPESALDVEVEGGTIGNLTLHVSDLPSFAPGDRAVFYLQRSARGALVPFRRGLGLLKLDRSQRVLDSNLTLEDIRRSVRAGAGR